jgi:hypothetical protein
VTADTAVARRFSNRLTGSTLFSMKSNTVLHYVDGSTDADRDLVASTDREDMRSQGNSCVALGIRLFLAALAPRDREGPGFPELKTYGRRVPSSTSHLRAPARPVNQDARHFAP